jgi:hypothetical protein
MDRKYPMKQNDTVKVFQKPITDELPEGFAQLLEQHLPDDNSGRGEFWTVKFQNGDIVNRWVHARNLVGSRV